MAVKNTCTPQTVYGGYDQTLFLGCSVMSFTASAGWGSQSSNLTVNLVKDTCAGPKVYWDGTLTRQSWTAADPGFLGLTYRIVGCPVYFRVADFEFSGIVQSWNETNSASGKPTYQVIITDPRQIIQNAQIITGDYQGGVGNITNIINAYGFLEAFGDSSVSCPQYSQVSQGVYSPGDLSPDWAVFGSESGGYGGSEINSNGMKWNRIAQAINALWNRIPMVTNAWSPFGRLLFRGVNANGFGLMGYDRVVFDSSGSALGYLNEYYIDISEIPNVSDFIRLSGTKVSVMDAITAVCDACGYDYYVELIPVYYPFIAPISNIGKFIKIRIVSRNVQPDLTAIDTFIANSDGCVSTSVGRELRNETTSRILIGGPIEFIYQTPETGSALDRDPEQDGQPNPIELDDIILPYFGLDEEDDIIIPRVGADGDYYFCPPLSFINNRLEAENKLGPGTVGWNAWNAAHPADQITPCIKITERELRAAAHSMISWLTISEGMQSDIWKNFNAGNGFGGKFQLNIAAPGAVPQVAPKPHRNRDAINNAMQKGHWAQFQNNPNEAEAKLALDLETVYEWVANYAKEYYGKQFQIRVPYTRTRYDDASGEYISSEVPHDSGWTEVPLVADLNNPSTALTVFMNDEGKLKCFAKFNSATSIDLVNIGTDEFWLDEANNKVWIGADVQGEYQYVDRANRTDPRAIVSFPAGVYWTASKPKGVGGGLMWLQAMVQGGRLQQQDADDIIDNHDQEGWDNFMLEVGHQAAIPHRLAIPMKSNVQSYGPWGSAGPAGPTDVETDTNLVPWRYGSMATLDTAGQELADAGLVNMQVGEMGDLQVPGYPTLPLGSELGAVAGGYFGAGTNLIENRSAALNNFNDNNNGNPSTIQFACFSYSGNWTGLYGPNVTGINVNVGPGGVTTSYSMRTFTPSFGSFAKHNSKAIEEMRIRELKGQQDARNRFKRRNQAFNQGFAAKNKIERDNDMGPPHTPHDYLIGSYIWDQFDDGTNLTRPSAVTRSLQELVRETSTDAYKKKGIMGWEGLVRPVTMDGLGGLPQFAHPSGTISCSGYLSQSEPPTPPVSGYNPLRIVQQYLNPWTNPPGFSRSDKYANAAVTHGHDIDILSRDTAGATGGSGASLSIQKAWNTTAKGDYANDYRGFAFKGPMLIQQWGYDIEGKPIPNKVDVEIDASGGVFKATGLKDEFIDNFLRKSHTWPVAPVDLRFDRKRGVWVSPQGFRIVKGVMLCDLIPSVFGGAGVASGTITDGPIVYDANGNAVAKTVRINDVLDHPVASGSKFLAYYDPYECKYNILNSQYRPVCMVSDICLTTGNSWTCGSGSGSCSGYKVTLEGYTRKIYLPSMTTVETGTTIHTGFMVWTG